MKAFDAHSLEPHPELLVKRVWQQVAQPQAARVFSRPEEFRFLEPFLAQECSVGQAAPRVGVSPSRMFRWVKKLQGLGLIEESRQCKRAGRPIRFYQSVAEAFFVPFGLTPMTGLEEQLQILDDYYRQPLLKTWANELRAAEQELGLEVGLRCFRAKNGKCIVIHALGPEEAGQPFAVLSLLLPDRPALWNSLNTLELELHQAKALQHELYALLMRYFYHSQSSPASQPYTLRLSVAPNTRFA